MAGKPKPMSQIKQSLILHRQGKGIKTIARSLGISKNTVKAYLAKFDGLSIQGTENSAESLLKLESPELEARFHPGNPAYKDGRYEHLKADIDYYLKELGRTGVHKRLLWGEYREANPDGYGYSQFCFHLQQQKEASRPSAVLQHVAGDKLYIDFAGKNLSYADRETGEEIECQVFVACMPFSDYGFAMAVPSQSVSDFLYALSCCLRFLGAVPKALVPDNLKSAVTKASRYEPDTNRAMEDFAAHYGAAVLPARVRRPKDKALVENQVKLLYSRVYAKLRNREFFDLHSLNEAIKCKVRAHNQTRMQQKPYCREEQYLAEEKKLMSALPCDPFELKSYCELKAAKNNHIYLSEDKHYYSVPYRLIGLKMKVLYTRSMVYIYHGGKQVAVHIRGFKQGGYTTTSGHLCSQHRHYRDRSPDYYRKLASGHSDVLSSLFEYIFSQDRYPEQLYKTCDGLLGLSRKSDPENFRLACQTAIDHEVYSYTFIKNILENNMAGQDREPLPKKLPTHKNVRGKEYYQTELQLDKQQKNESDRNKND
jgi:transposase